MFSKQWVAEFDGHSIRVTNSWLGGAQLYIDGVCRDANKDLFDVSGAKPRLSAQLDSTDTQSARVEVFFKAILAVRARISVNGRQVGGDLT